MLSYWTSSRSDRPRRFRHRISGSRRRRRADRVGGSPIRDRDLLLSALAAPLPVFGEEVYLGLYNKAGILMLASNRDHPLSDGNKRLSWRQLVAECVGEVIDTVRLRLGISLSPTEKCTARWNTTH